MGSLLQKLQEELTDLTEGLHARQARDLRADGVQGKHPSFLTEGGEQLREARLERHDRHPRERSPGLGLVSSQRIKRQQPRQPPFKGCMVPALGLEKQEEAGDGVSPLAGREFSLKQRFLSLA